MDELTVYTTGPSCGKCSTTKMMLKGKGIPFVEVDITQNPAAREYVTEELGYSMAPPVRAIQAALIVAAAESSARCMGDRLSG